MSDQIRQNRFAGTATVMVLSFLLFYFPSVLAVFSREGEPKEWIIMHVVMATFYTAVFCVNYFWLVPATLVHADRKPLYFLANFCLITAICSLIPIWFENHGGLPMPQKELRGELSAGQYLMGYVRFLIRDGIMMVLSAGLAYALRLSKEHENMRRRQLELNAEKRQIELKNLKAQLNPHFLFNTLNNIYALIGIAPDRAQQALHDLSSMLRYMIYDSASAYVPVAKEIRFITDYVELMRLRLSPSVDMDFTTYSGADSDIYIAPLLFLTIVENGFKHFGPNGRSQFIHIQIKEENGDLVCMVKNSFSEKGKQASKEQNAEGAGIGLANVRRQLGLLYPGRHTLNLSAEDGVHTARIAISVEALKNHALSAHDVKTLD